MTKINCWDKLVKVKQKELELEQQIFVAETKQGKQEQQRLTEDETERENR